MDEVSQKLVKLHAMGARHPKYAQGVRLSRPEATLNREL